jgi:hypothetical protein
VELFDDIEPPDRQDLCNYLHSSLLYNAYETGTTSTISISLSATSGTVTITSSGAAFVAGNVGKRIRTIDKDGITQGEGKITAVGSPTGCTITVSNTFSSLAFAASRWGISVSTIIGLDHLEGESARVLADGGVDNPAKTVSAGTITLAYNYFVVRVGLPYDQIVYTLPKEGGNNRGTAQGKIQRINEIAFKVNRSHRGFKAGESAAELDVVATRDPSTPMGTPEQLFTGIIPNISFRGNYAYGSQIYIKNEDPLPVELLSIMLSVDTYEK